MKNFLLLMLCVVSVFNCSNELEFNEHALQATKDGEQWKATDFRVRINEDGYITVVGVYKDQVLSINIESTETGVYDLGAGSNSTAWHTDGKGNGFTTEYRGNGEVTIDKFDVATQSFTGSFKFNAFSSEGEVVNFINGVFYQVPVVTDEIVEDEEGEFKASIDDSELEADEIIAINDNGIIEIQGKSADGQYVKLFVPENTIVGSYNLNEQSASGTYAVYGFANGATTIAQYGTLFISEHHINQRKIQGTFTFTTLLPNSVSVENGSFKAYY